MTFAATGTDEAMLDYQVSQRAAEEAAGERRRSSGRSSSRATRVFFDEMCLHQTASEPSMPNPRYAIENWFFGGSAFPPEYVARRGLVAVGPVPQRSRTAGASRWRSIAELMLPCLDAAGVRSVVEVGAFAGDLTRRAGRVGGGRRRARVAAVDPSPQPGLVALAEEHPELELIRETSLAALPALPELPDAVIIDGDHNYFTVSEELRLIGERAPAPSCRCCSSTTSAGRTGAATTTSTPSRSPSDFRQPIGGRRGGLVPGEPGVALGGLPYPRSAEREGGPRNGVLTAVEDFVGEPRAACGSSSCRCSSASASSGTHGRAVRRRARRASSTRGTATRSLERLEANRVLHLAESHQTFSELWARARAARRAGGVLRRMLESSAFAVAERLSRLRMRAGVATESVGGLHGGDPARARRRAPRTR